MKLTGQEWVVAMLIGLAAVTAALFGWRAAQIGSTAAFEDRTSIGSTIAVQQAQIEVDIAAADDAGEYVRYLADYAVATALDRQADAATAEQAVPLRAEAADLRRGATRRAATAGVFGMSSIADDIRTPSPKPRAFNFDAHRASLAAELETQLQSGGSRDPQASADTAESIRDRVDGLIQWAFVLFVAVLLFTVAQVWRKSPRIFWGFAAAGLVLYLVGTFAGLSSDFFSGSL